MARGILKLIMLKLIAEQPASGYDLLARVEAASGSKPSTGTIYPMLKQMEADGWISSHAAGRRNEYSITEMGEHIIESHAEGHIKDEYLKKVHGSIALASNAFEDAGDIDIMAHIEPLLPVIGEITDAVHSGIPFDDVKEAVSQAIKELTSKIRMKERGQ